MFAHRHVLCSSLVGKHVQSACVCLFVIFPESYSCILSPLTRTHSIHTHKHSLDTRKQGRGPKNTTGDKPFHSPGDCDGVAETSLLQGFLGRYVRFCWESHACQGHSTNPRQPKETPCDNHLRNLPPTGEHSPIPIPLFPHRYLMKSQFLIAIPGLEIGT